MKNEEKSNQQPHLADAKAKYYLAQRYLERNMGQHAVSAIQEANDLLKQLPPTEETVDLANDLYELAGMLD